jgi:hypothetical protein
MKKSKFKISRSIDGKLKTEEFSVFLKNVGDSRSSSQWLDKTTAIVQIPFSLRGREREKEIFAEVVSIIAEAYKKITKTDIRPDILGTIAGDIWEDLID